MKLESVSLPTDKQYLYYLIISQLYSDGHMEAAMKLEMSVLDSAGHVIPSNRLSSILSACLLSLSDVADYLSNRQSNAKPLTPPSPPTSLSNLSSMTRKRLHSGPPTLYPSNTPSDTTPPPPAPPAPIVMLTQTNGDSNTTTNTPQPQEEDLIQSQLSKELEEICNAAVQEVTAKGAETSPKQDTAVKIEPDIKIEPCEAESAVSAAVPDSVSSTPLSTTPLLTSADPPTNPDEATQNLINNLSNITSISEINEITELTQSLVESLVQGNTVFNNDTTTGGGGVENNNIYNVVPPVSSVTSPTKEDLIDSNDKSTTPLSLDSTYTQNAPSIVLAANPETFPQLSVYKQNNTLLNIMGYNCTNSRNKPFRRHRTRFNDEQVAAMERYYTNISRYARPDNGLPELIRETGLTHDTIMLWFQNKRARDKRKGWDDTGGGGGGSSGEGKRAKTD